MLFSNPRVLPALLVIIGLGLIVFRGNELEAIPQWTAADIDTAVELNYALDLARVPRNEDGSFPTIPFDEAEKAKAAIRKELEDTFIKRRHELEREVTQGHWLVGIGLVLMVIVLALQQRGLLKKS